MLRILLFPFSLIYGFAAWMRNKWYDWGIIKCIEFDVPVICIGNLSVGGTGKTPHIEYFVSLLSKNHPVATLSRGYGRKTKGFILADESTSARDIGDEPFQIKQKFPSIMVAVGEDRALAIPEMLAVNPELQAILLDDAFQHRSVKAGLNILLTPFDSPFYNDWILPAGRLRELRGGAQRADAIIITRCPQDLTEPQKKEIETRVEAYNADAPVLYSAIRYGGAYSLFNTTVTSPSLKGMEIVLLCGIANPASITSHLNTLGSKITPHFYPDHFPYRTSDLEKVKASFNNLPADKRIILTTEKDAARLMNFKEWFTGNKLDVWVLPIEVVFNGHDKNRLNQLIFDHLKLTIPNG